MHFVRDLIRRWWKTIISGAIISQIPKWFAWLAEQWAGNHVVDLIDGWLRRISMGTIATLASTLWSWMALHPIQSAFFSTILLVGIFSIETELYERKRRETITNTISGTEVLRKPAQQSVAKPLGNQSLATGDGREQKIQIDARNHASGIILEVKQVLDPDRAFPCEIILVDLKKITEGQAHAVSDLHKPDGSFKYGRVFLDLATTHRELYFNNAASWWLISQGVIGYAWGSQRERGQIALPEGTWIASVEINAGDFTFARQFTFSCDGRGDAKLV